MNTLPLVAYVVITIYSRIYCRRCAADGAEVAEESRDGPAGEVAGETAFRAGWSRALLNLLPTAMLVLAPAVEYALLHDLAGSSFFERPMWSGFAIIGTGMHLFAARLAGAAVFELAGALPGCLVTSGPYARIRHPMALSHILQGMGGGLLLGMRLGWVVWLAGSLLFVLACLLEDRELAGQFPEAHAAWGRRVPAFLPGRAAA